PYIEASEGGAVYCGVGRCWGGEIGGGCFVVPSHGAGRGFASAADLRPSGLPSFTKKPKVFLARSAPGLLCRGSKPPARSMALILRSPHTDSLRVTAPRSALIAGSVDSGSTRLGLGGRSVPRNYSRQVRVAQTGRASAANLQRASRSELRGCA